ncbi:MAG: TetR/AcrR family transcriptional regulator [Propionibacteriaceae bacterium]|jgi:AcrR family transcriptional regulator|nr:TetR/AcrR family transcriptional regulator [Propionibacteriaceae bacterium]
MQQTLSTLRERRRNQTLREIADAALRLFSTQGYKQTTIEEVARAAGVSSRTVFRYFASKSELVFDWFPDLEQLILSFPLVGNTLPEILRDLELGIQHAIDDYGEAMDATTAADYRTFRQLTSQDPDLRTALAGWEQQLVQLARKRIKDHLASSITETPSEQNQPSSAKAKSQLPNGLADQLSAGLLVELVMASVRVALDVWAETPNSDLSSIYAQARQSRDALLADG